MSMTLDNARKIATHKHYKGGLYRYLGVATHTESEEALAIYEHIFPHRTGELFARPITEFYDWVWVKGEGKEKAAEGEGNAKRVRRFEPLADAPLFGRDAAEYPVRAFAGRSSLDQGG